MFFTIQFLYLTDRLNKVRTKLKNVIKSFEMTLNSNYRLEKIKTENQRNRKMKKKKSQKTQKDKNLVLAKKQVENADFYKPVLNEIMTTRE